MEKDVDSIRDSAGTRFEAQTPELSIKTIEKGKRKYSAMFSCLFKYKTRVGTTRVYAY